MTGRARSFGTQRRTKFEQRTAAMQLLTLRASLDGLTPETLTRSYGIPAPEAADLIEQERKRRGLAA